MSADLAVIAEDPTLLERAADPGEFLMLACERAKSWLAEALANGEIDRIAEMKAQAEAIRVYTVSKQLGKDAVISASEIVRRAERGLGLATRKGQAAGTIRQRGHGGGTNGPYVRNGHVIQAPPLPADKRSSPSEYIGHGGQATDIYAMTDDVTDEEFNEVISRGRAKGDLSRKSVADKLRQRRDGIPDSPYTSKGLTGWQANVRAIALALEALRAVDRYGVTRRGEQYTGWAAIEAPRSEFADAYEAETWMRAYAVELNITGPGDQTPLRTLYRLMAVEMHPDRGAPRAEWDRLDAARRLVDAR